ncbi:MAG: hypothetical protein EXS14_01505 [Planctomycetes bacterium]|nr:hypothetical protein [Planctomycetota bacterium]
MSSTCIFDRREADQRSHSRALAWLLPVALLAFGALLPAQTLMWINEGSTSTFGAGWSLARAGDLTGDGVTEVLVGANDPALGAGTVRIISLATGATVRTHVGEATGNQFGYDVAGGFDANLDGVPDVLIGAPGFDVGTSFDNRGRAYVYSGLTGTLLYSVTGVTFAENCGYSVAWLGDINADGRADFAVGLSGAASMTGRVRVCSGLDGSTLLTLNGEAVGDRFGAAVAYAGDMNADGIPDLLVGAPYQTVNGIAGRAYIYAMPAGTLLQVFNGVQSAEHHGWALCSVPDISGDGVRDVVVGAPDYDAIFTDAGRARAFNSATGNVLWEFAGNLIHLKAGIDLDAMPDLDADGIGDVIIGLPYIPP